MCPGPYNAPIATAPVSAAVVEISQAASGGKLVVCGGAGLSLAEPTGLPSGSELGEMLDEKLERIVAGYSSPENKRDLIDVADAGASIPGGETAMRHLVLELAKFESADPNHGHKVLASLLCEGGIDCVLLWNWDDCVERADLTNEHLRVAHSKGDMDALDHPHIAKIHGDVARPSSLLVTSKDLEEAPVWATETFADRIGRSTMVFVGIGDVADYARHRLEKLHADFPDLDVWVVSPGIAEKWDESEWKAILPTLSSTRRVALTADEFLDQLARQWVRALFDNLAGMKADADPAIRVAIDAAENAMAQLSAEPLLRWCREAVLDKSTGKAVVGLPAFAEVICAVAMLAANDGDEDRLQARRPASIGTPNGRYEAMVVCKTAGVTQIRAKARQRAESLVAQGIIESDPTFVVAGTWIGRLDGADLEFDVYSSDPRLDDIFSGPAGVGPRFVSAFDVLKTA